MVNSVHFGDLRSYPEISFCFQLESESMDRDVSLGELTTLLVVVIRYAFSRSQRLPTLLEGSLSNYVLRWSLQPSFFFAISFSLPVSNTTRIDHLPLSITLSLQLEDEIVLITLSNW